MISMGNADLIQNYCNDPIFSNRSDLPPTLKITPNLQECSGSLLEMEKLTLVGPNPASLKAPYKLCAKSFNNNNNNNKSWIRELVCLGELFFS